ncbi:thiol:disulfide interchange protein [Chryseobacterium sp. ERMR1:04]|uniref:thiol:disulfide interchange protein n=1 Tax=Chryseobacterium sp. ERMR1:04 TaxID=1705393 RepID=UPI0006C8D0A0|nr:thiol:disulfide interchange protein [Chryseobacterium sp. ERMR1:04]KPH12920.1 thiol:disulfide interchange protein [Chryseobacterium sp. ERMR1:04]
MKLVTIFLFLMFVPCLCLSQIKTGTFYDVEIGQKDTPKPIIIHLYTDWCAVCKIESFQLNKDKDLVKMINNNFYFINFEAEKTKDTIHFQGKEFSYLPNGNSGIHELALALSKNKKQPVYPLWIILDSNQKLIYYHEGEFKPEKMNQKLEEILKL